MGWLAAASACSTSACTAVRYGVTALTIILFLMALRRSGERAVRLTERLSTLDNTHEIQRQMLDAASRRPADRDALAQRLRDGRF
jgi:hypothetical protein